MSSLNPYQSPAPTAPQPAPAQQPAAPDAKDFPYGSLDLITRLVQGQYFLVAALSLAMALAAAQAQQTVAEMQLLQRKSERQVWSSAEYRGNSGRYEFLERKLKDRIHTLELLSGPAVLLLGLVLLATEVMWTYRAAANLPALAAVNKQSPWVAALSMAIPGVNVLASIGVLNQIAKGSDPRGYSAQGSGEGSSSQLVIWWWLTNLISVAGGVYAILILGPGVTNAMELEYYLRTLTAVAGYSIVPLGLAPLMFGAIAANQDRRRDKVLAPPPMKKAAGSMDFLK